MRLIDADKFEAYSANGTDLEGEEFLAYLSGMQRVLEDIDAAPTIDPESLRPRCIPVTERLPETDGENTHAHDVLVYIPKRDGCNQHGIYVGKVSHIPPDDGRGNFWGIKTEASDWTVWGWSYFETPVVTHWMPLPEPPEVSDH